MAEHANTPAPVGGDLIMRHAMPTRLWHWISAVLTLGLLMSGLMIYNAHPRFYWGDAGAHFDPAWLEIGAADQRGFFRVGDLEMTTTGVLGISDNGWGEDTRRAFPTWATLPWYYDLAGARRWHLGLAWIFAAGTLGFLFWSVLNGHFWRDLVPRRTELRPSNIWHHCCEHARLRLPRGAAAARYNIFQKLAYLGVTGGMIPLLVLTGLTMSPMINAAAPWMLDMFGGRQSARSLHFIAAFSLVAFVVLHVAMVFVAGPLNELRSMLTGWFRLPKERNE